ncbi:hypothetical protein DYB30_002478 [Aphanomyces astaci]|uniref:Uncharacterized protein n=1 Tax=Aphanomyces astaci TaxID=112090 RepID=A0A397CXE8_APHAT|nr:hypothetical protein DYB30_002478 [Aphanomyces astaci]
MDELVGILKRELDEFMATHASTVLSKMGEEHMDDVCRSEVERIGTMWSVMASRNFAVAIDTLLQWQSVRLDGSLFGHVGLWLTGHVLRTVLRHPIHETCDAVWDTLVAAAFKVLSGWNHVESCVGADRSFFVFHTAPSKPSNDFLLQQAVHMLWKDNIGLMGTCAIGPIKQHFLMDLDSLAASAVTKESYLNNFSMLRLCLIRPGATFDAAAQASTSFLRVLTSCTHKVHKPSVRLVALQVLAAILTRELTGLSTAGLRAYHDADGTTAEWTSLVADLHAIGHKQSQKKRFAVVAWHVRVAVLMLSDAAMFAAWWKADALALLQAYGQHNASIPFLHLVELLLRHLVKRHVAAASRSVDLMEIVNAIQAWCFTNSKHKLKKMRVIFSVLSRLSLSIAAYNMPYAVDNHIHHLIADSDSIYEVRRLVGLQSLRHLLQHTGLVVMSAAPPVFSIALDKAALVLALPSLGDVVSNILVDCSGHLDSPVRPGKSNEFKHWIGLQTFEASIYSTQVLFAHMTLHPDQKLLLLTRSAIHDDESIRVASAATLRHLARTLPESSVLQALVSFMLQAVDKADRLPILLEVVESILLDPSLPLRDALDTDVEPVEALGLFLLCHTSVQVRRQALVVLDAVRLLRQGRLRSTKINAMDILTGIDGDLQNTLGLQLAHKQMALEAGGVIQWLAKSTDQSTSANSEWLWSLCLATLFPRLCEICPTLIDHVWTRAVTTVYAIEPDLPIDTDDNFCTPSQWRNLAILTCATATKAEDVVGTLLKRLCAFLTSLSLEQRISATLALSATHAAAHVELLEHLTSLEGVAFPKKPPAGSIPRGTSIKDIFAPAPSKHPPCVLQWAMARCVRSLVHHRIQLWSHAPFRQLVLDVVDKLYGALTTPPATPPPMLSQANGWQWWVQHEFCAIVESIVHQNNLLVVLDDDTADVVTATTTREMWFGAMWQWCADQPRTAAPADVRAAMLLPYVPPDESTPWQQFQLAKRAYQAMSMLMVGPVFTDVAPVFAWMDGAFAAGADDDLQAIVVSGLRLLVQSDPGAIIPQTVDRCFYTDATSCVVATHYLHVVASVVVDLRDEFMASPSLCELIFVALLHLHPTTTTDAAAAAMHILVTMGQDREGVPHAYQPHHVPAKPATTRQLQHVTNQIARRWAAHSVDVLHVMLSYVVKCAANPALQSHVMAQCSPWVTQLDAIDKQCMTLLFRLTVQEHDGDLLPALSALWLDVAHAKDYCHVPPIVSFLFSLPTHEKFVVAKHVINWMSASPMDSHRLVSAILAYADAQDQTLRTSCVAVVLLSGLAVTQSDDDDEGHRVVMVAHRVFSVLFAELHDRASAHDDVFDGVEADGLAIVDGMLHKDASVTYLTMQNAVHEYLATIVSPPSDSQMDGQEPSSSPADLFETLVESFCRLVLTDAQRRQWAAMAVQAFTTHHFDARFGLLLYRLGRPPFDGSVCVHMTKLLAAAMSNPNEAAFVPEYLVTLTHMTSTMPDAKLALYPQLLWETVTLLRHTHDAYQQPALRLLEVFVTKSTFPMPIVQDMLLASRPSGLKAGTAMSSSDVSVDILLAACHNVDAPATADLARSIVTAVLGSNVTSKLHCVLCTAVLVPFLSVGVKSSTVSVRQELGFLWRVQNQAHVAAAFLHDIDGTMWQVTDDLGRLLMAALAFSPDEEKAFFDTVLVILNGRCDAVKHPTLILVHKMVQAAPELFWKRNGALLAALTRILRTTGANDATWPVLVSVLSTLLPCP